MASPYRTIEEARAVEERRGVGWGVVEAVAWFVLMQSTFTRALSGLVRPELDSCDTGLACFFFVVASIALGLRVRR